MEEIKGLNLNPEWCKECSNHLVLNVVKKLIEQQRWNTRDFVIISGIGNSAKIPAYLNYNSFITPSGEAIPVACGIKSANHNLNTVVLIGDGGLLSDGMKTLIHSARRNIDITVLVLNNLLLCSTGSYPSPTTPNNIPDLIWDVKIFNPISIIKIALACNATFIARGATAQIDHLNELVNRAVEHKGFSLVEIFEPCRSHFSLDYIMSLERTLVNIDEKNQEPDNRTRAYSYADEKDYIPIGLIYRSIKPSYLSNFPCLAEDTLVNQIISRKKLDVFLQKFLKF
ncbi:MAG TPA: hypothetical protein ENN73_00940 [Firmicutes bacterium]|nr:hypothetical protein [Bacillota bacterium]